MKVNLFGLYIFALHILFEDETDIIMLIISNLELNLEKKAMWFYDLIIKANIFVDSNTYSFIGSNETKKTIKAQARLINPPVIIYCF